jgi:hypothetical protein
MPRSLRALTLWIVATTFPGTVEAAELVYVADRACAPCQLFDRQVRPLYAKTTEAALAPLRTLPYAGSWPARYAFIARPSVAPTFVLVDDGRELGRFEGYAGDELFWMRLTVLLRALD